MLQQYKALGTAPCGMIKVVLIELNRSRTEFCEGSSRLGTVLKAGNCPYVKA